MTPEDIHQITFGRAPFGSRGYREREVDELLDVIAGALAGRIVLTSAHLDRELPAAPLLSRGYHPDQVDAFLRRIRAEFGL
ncbi:DivIVA domain-containing protein [Nocardia sp. NPDC003345]